MIRTHKVTIDLRRRWIIWSSAVKTMAPRIAAACGCLVGNWQSAHRHMITAHELERQYMSNVLARQINRAG